MIAKRKFFSLMSLFLCIFFLHSQSEDGILNGKDDFEFAEALAMARYHKLAEKFSRKLQKAYPDKEERSDLLRAKLLQIQANYEPKFAQKEQYYKDAIAIYRKLISKTSGVDRYQTQLELGRILVRQGAYWIIRAQSFEKSKQEKIYRQMLPLMEEAYNALNQLVIDLKGKKNKGNSQLANFLYHGWFEKCRSLYFQGKCGKEEAFERCFDEVDSYLWKYDGRLGAYQAMILKGMALHETKTYEEAIDYYDGALKPFEDIATIHAYSLHSAESGRLLNQILEAKNRLPKVKEKIWQIKNFSSSKDKKWLRFHL